MVVTVNVPVVAPAATVIVPGTVAAALLEVNATDAPPVGAPPDSVAVPVELVPPTTEVGLTEIEVNVAGPTVRVAVALAVGRAAVAPVIVTVLVVVTAVVVAVNVAVFVPAATATLAGTVVDGSLDVRFTVPPSAGVLPANVIVPVDETPPVTDVGFIAIVLMNGASIRRDALADPPFVAVMWAVRVASIGTVVTVNVPVVAPAATVTLPGTVAAALSEDSVSVNPPAPAGAAKVTVPTELLPPSTDVPTRARLKLAGAVMVRIAFWLVPFAVAVIVEVVFVVTAVVETVKVPVVAPAATDPEPVTVADVELDVVVNANPPAGAAPLMVTVAVEGLPPTTDVGLRAIPVIVSGFTVSVAVAFAVGIVVVAAVIVTVFVVATARVVAVNVVLFVPAATVTLAGTVVEASLDDKLTVIGSPAGALPANVTVPAEEAPPTTVEGLSVTVFANGASMSRAALTV